jgi:hypothetical protein
VDTVTRLPQCAQNGNDASTVLPQRVQMMLDGAGEVDTRVLGTPAGGPEAGVEDSTAGWGLTFPAASRTIAGTTRASEGAMGLPQSMQKREFALFSRPQNAHTLTPVTPHSIAP